jgi:hypothetical protein
MSINKRWVSLEQCISALKEGKLKQYYGKSEILLFEDNTCSLIYKLHIQGKSDNEILNTIKNYEQKSNQNVKDLS